MSEPEYFDMICNTADGVYIVDENKHIVRWNTGAEKILKYSESDVLQHDCHRIISGKLSPDKPLCGQSCRVHAGVLKGSPQKNFDLLTHASDGEQVWLNVTIVSPARGDHAFVAHIFHDITREKKTNLAVDLFINNLGSQGAIPVNGYPEQPLSRPAAAERPSAVLSNREIEVLKLLAEGLSTKSLAQKLEISHFTARNHIQNILVKLDLHSKAQAVSYAFKKGIL